MTTVSATTVWRAQHAKSYTLSGTVQHLTLEDEPELFLDGAARVFEQPEFQDIAKMRVLLQMFDEKLSMLQELLGQTHDDAVHVRIGSENTMEKLGGVSVVAKDCHLGHTAIGGVAVVGPTRMRYAKVVSLVDYVADTLSETIERL